MIIWGITGWKNSGKTGLVERLVAHMTARGLSVSTIKHAHQSFDLDQDGTDSDRHRKAGSREVLITSPKRFAIMGEYDEAPKLDDLIARMNPVDLLIVEGFKREPIPKIECVIGPQSKPLVHETAPNVRALAAKNFMPDADLPVLDLDATADIADFILSDGQR